MKKLFLILIAAFMVASCVSVNPATGNYPVTGDVLECFIDGIPYEFVDERQYYRSVEKDQLKVDGLWIDVDKKGRWYVLYNVAASGDASLSQGSPPTPTARFAPIDRIKYVERPFRRN